MKSQDGKLRFGFLTGVTKLGKLSIFSGLNNVEDISLSRTYADLCGISEADLHHYFTQSVQELAQANELTQEECFAQLKDYYDGYHFAPDTPDIYNPFSLLRCLKSREFGDYWYETGTPTFVIKALQRGQYDLADLSLTPNSPFAVRKFAEDFKKGDTESLMKRFEAFFADADYEIVGDAELYFQNTMYVMCKLMGQYTQVERHTSNGRMDIVVQTDKYIYILELKMDASADEALQQIEDKGYAKPFAADPRKLFKIGIGFSSETRRIKEWKMA